MIPPRCFGVLALVLAASSAHADEPPVPARGLELNVVPQANGPWAMVLTNAGTTSLRVPADARFLSLEVIAPPDVSPVGEKKRGHRVTPVRGYPRGSLPVCKMPAGMRPSEPTAARELVLHPGERYSETFDPVAFCGAGKLARELVRGAVVYPSFGFPLPKHRAKNHGAPPPPPYAAEPSQLGDQAPPRRLVEGPGVILGDPREPSPDDDVPPDSADTEPAGETDPRAPKLSLHAEPHADAEETGDVTIAIRITNVGKRKATFHLRHDDVEVRVVTPTGATIRCEAGAERRAVVRDLFESLAPGRHRSLAVLLRERCPVGTFDRPGGYVLTPTLVLHDRGTEWGLSALVGRVPSVTSTHLRVRTGRLPYHVDPPTAEKP